MSLYSPHDIYVRHTAKCGSSHVQSHRVWDAERFMQARMEEAKKVGGKAKAEQLTHEEFLSQKK